MDWGEYSNPLVRLLLFWRLVTTVFTTAFPQDNDSDDKSYVWSRHVYNPDQ